MGSAFMGMAGGVIAVLAVCWGIMALTNLKFADHAPPEAAAPAATTTGGH